MNKSGIVTPNSEAPPTDRQLLEEILGQLMLLKAEVHLIYNRNSIIDQWMMESNKDYAKFIEKKVKQLNKLRKENERENKSKKK